MNRVQDDRRWRLLIFSFWYISQLFFIFLECQIMIYWLWHWKYNFPRTLVSFIRIFILNIDKWSLPNDSLVFSIFILLATKSTVQFLANSLMPQSKRKNRLQKISVIMLIVLSFYQRKNFVIDWMNHSLLFSCWKIHPSWLN